MSKQERVSWGSLLIHLVIGYWYFSHVLRLPADADLFGPGMWAFATGLIVTAIVLAVAGEIALDLVQRHAGGGADATQADERDSLIDLKSCRNAYTVLCLAVVAVIVQIVLLEARPRWSAAPGGGAMPMPDTVFERIFTGPHSAPLLAQLLLLALTVAGLTVYASRIFYYRRGY